MTAEQERLEEAREREVSDASHPDIGLLSNGRNSVMITAAGGGWGAWGDMDVTRWREMESAIAGASFAISAIERGVRSVTVDGQSVSGGTVPLLNDGCEHDVRVELG